MNQPQFTLQELNDIREYHFLLSEERFHYYLTHLYGWTKEQCRVGFTAFRRFPFRLREEDYPIITTLLPLVKEVLALITPVSSSNLTINDNDDIQRKLKVIYREEKYKREIVVDFCRASDVITYSELLKRGIEVITQLDFVERIRSERMGNEEIDVYEGDIFLTEEGGEYAYDSSHSKYIICRGRSYYRLLYTQGKGYIRGGNPDYDKENRFNSYEITLGNRWEKVGNTYLDLSFLKDNNNSNESKTK